MAPTSIRNTLNTIGLVGATALLIVLAFMSFIKILQSPPEILLGFAMAIFGFFAIRDVYQLPARAESDGTRMIEKAFK